MTRAKLTRARIKWSRVRVSCDRYHPYHPTQEQYREAWVKAWTKP